MKTVRLQLGELLAADATTLAPAADANTVALIAAPFTPSEILLPGDLTLATFTGSAPKDGAVGAQQAGIDPTTGDQVITILAPLGGYRYECTVAPGAPETIYGYALMNDDQTLLFAVAALPVPVTITSVGDFIDLGAIIMTIVAQPIS